MVASEGEAVTDDEKLLLGGAAAAAAVLGISHRKEIVDVIKRGQKLTRSSWLGGSKGAYGVIEQDPEALLAVAQMQMGRAFPLDIYSLARMIRSEGATEARARAHVAFNDLNRFRYADTMHELLTYSTDPQRRGRFGVQYSPAAGPFSKANKRRYATSRDPYEGDVLWAERVWNERARGIDPTKGAVKFLDKSVMGKQPGSVSFPEKDAQWRREGLIGYTLPEFGDDLVLYRRA